MEMILNSIHGGISGGANSTVYTSLVNGEQLDRATGGGSGDHSRIEAIPDNLSAARSAGGMSNGCEEVSGVVRDLLLLLEASEVAEDALLLNIPEENAVISAGGQHKGEVIMIPNKVQHTLGVT